MKKTNITITFDEERLSALKMYLEQKGQTVEGELENMLESIYTKTVPVGVREFINMKAGVATPSRQKKTRVVSSSAVGIADSEVNENDTGTN